VGFQGIQIHFTDRTETLSLDPVTGDLNAIRHYMNEILRCAPPQLCGRALSLLGNVACPWVAILQNALRNAQPVCAEHAASALENHLRGLRNGGIGALSAALQNDTPLLRRAVWRALLSFGGAEPSGDTSLGAHYGASRWRVTKVMIEAEAMQTGQDSPAEDWIGHWVGGLRDPRAVQPMLEILRGARPGRPAIAIGALAGLRDPRAVPDLIRVLRTGPASLKTAAASALGEICDPRAIPVLAAAMKKGDVALRKASTQAMVLLAEAYQEPDCLLPLIDRLRDEPEIRLFAAWGLSFLRDPRSDQPLHDALLLPDVDQPIQWLDTRIPSTACEAIQRALEALL
jgi:hypothetical protein